MVRGGKRTIKLTCRVVDQELSAKLESELQVEKEMRDSDKVPVNIQDFLDNNSFEVSRQRYWTRFQCSIITAPGYPR